MADNEARLILSAETARFNQAMDAAQTRVQGITGGISDRFRTMSNDVTANVQNMQSGVSSQFDRIGGAFSKVNALAIGLAGVLAGGLMFRAAIDKTVELEKESVKLGRQLGISATEASVLSVALDDVYQDSSVLEAGMSKLVKTLSTDEQAFTRLGVSTRDQNGNFRSQLDIMLDVNQALGQFKEGTDRNIEGMKVYGRSWKEVEPLIALTRDRMEESRKKAHELGLVVGQENVQSLNRYRAAMNDANDVVMAATKAVGDALLPILARMGEWFSSAGVPIVTAFKGAIGGLAATFWFLKNGVVLAWETINAAVQSIGASVVALGKAAAQAVTGNFEGAARTLQAVPGQVVGYWKDAFSEIERSSRETEKAVAALFGTQSDSGAPAGGQRGTSSDEDKAGGVSKRISNADATKSELAAFEARLAAARDFYNRQQLEMGSFQEFSKTQEQDFWSTILATENLFASARLAVEKKLYDASREVAKAAFAEKISNLKIVGEALRKEDEERVAIAREIAAAEAEKYGASSPQARQASGAAADIELDVLLNATQIAIDATARGSEERYYIIAEASNKIRDSYGLEGAAVEDAFEQLKRLSEQEAEFREAQQQRKLANQEKAALEELNIERATLEQKFALGEIDAQQEIAGLQLLAQKQYDIERAVLDEKLRLYDADLLKREEIKGRIVELEKRHLGETTQLGTEAIIEQARTVDEVLNPVAQGMARMINGFIEGTLTWRKAMSQVAQSLHVEMVNVGVQMTRDWLRNEIVKTQASLAANAVRGAAEKQSAIQSIATTAWAAIKIIGIKAWEAASAVYASIAAIPYIGPFLAPVMAVAAAATVISYVGRIASAAGGYDIPAGVNPLVQTHAREMILPAQYADVIRGMAGDGGGGGGVSVSVQYGSVSAIDARGMREVLRAHANDIGDVVRGQIRDFKKV